MKVFIAMSCLVSLTLAEPPVGDGYPAALSSYNHHHGHDQNEQHDHHNSEQQRSLSQEYGPPSFASSRNAFSNDYDTQNARSAPYVRGRSQSFAPATVRVSFNQRFGSATSSAQDHAAARSFSEEYSAPSARGGISQDDGPPAAKSLSQEYGVPSVVAARTLSTEYGVPNARSSPSEEYGAPVIAARSSPNPHSPTSTFRNAQPASTSQDYSTPAVRSQSQTESLSHGYTAPLARSDNVAQGYDSTRPFTNSGFTSRSPPSNYGAPSSRSLSPSYGAPSARNSDSQEHNSVSQTYGVPSQRDLSETYGAPSARDLSQEYRVPSSRANLKTGAAASSYAPVSSRSAPSPTYLPSTSDGSLSQQYGVPEQDNSQGYDNAQARALNELLNQEPASYDFGYQIEDQESGSDFGHTETREENRAQGSYFVVRPDGTKQTVEYEADERGFRPRISVEPAAAAGGYDENAADIARSSQGPY